MRLDIMDKLTGNNRWKTSLRYKQHYGDSPLYDPNDANVQRNAARITEVLDCIYTSPATRCIETSLILAEKLGGLPICVEYGLMESYLYNMHALNVGYVQNEMDLPVRIGQNIYVSNIDEIMMPEALAQRFPGLIVNKSIYDPTEIPLSMDFQTWAERQVSLLGQLRSRHTNLLIVAHAANIANCTPFVAKRSLDGFDTMVAGDNRTGTLAVIHGSNVVVYQGGELTYINEI